MRVFLSVLTLIVGVCLSLYFGGMYGDIVAFIGGFLSGSAAYLVYAVNK